MENWKKTIWRVPLICLLSGVFCTFFAPSLRAALHVIQIVDGEFAGIIWKEYIVFFCEAGAALIFGFFFLRKYSRREIARSATLMAVYAFLLQLAQWLVLRFASAPGITIIGYLYIPMEWPELALDLTRRLFPLRAVYSLAHWIDYNLLTSIPSCLMPYLFVPLGKKHMEPTTALNE